MFGSPFKTIIRRMEGGEADAWPFRDKSTGRIYWIVTDKMFGDVMDALGEPNIIAQVEQKRRQL